MKRMRIVLLSLFMAFAASAAFALPTVAEVQAEVQKGNYAQAQTMMREVVTAKPGSAKAHYIYAEILAHNARFDEAAQETRLAKQLDPAIKFTQADKFRAFEQMLDREQQNARAKAAASAVTKPVDLGPTTLPQTRSDAAPRQQVEARQAGGVPGWAWGLGIAVIAFFGWRMLSRGRSAAPQQQPMATSYGPGAAPYGSGQGVAPYGANPAYPQGGGYGPGGMAPSAGGGLMGVGLAAAGGVAAGMLAEKFMERGREAPHESNLGNANNGGGMFDRDSFAGGSQGLPDADARALESRDVDFGSGSDWTDAGSSDSGSSGGSDDW